MQIPYLIEITYLVASVLFIYGLKSDESSDNGAARNERGGGRYVDGDCRNASSS